MYRNEYLQSEESLADMAQRADPRRDRATALTLARATVRLAELLEAKNGMQPAEAADRAIRMRLLNLEE